MNIQTAVSNIWVSVFHNIVIRVENNDGLYYCLYGVIVFADVYRMLRTEEKVEEVQTKGN